MAMAWVQSQLCFFPPATPPPPGQVVICGDPQGEDTKEMLHCVHSVFSPNKVRGAPACQSFPGLCCLHCCCCFILSPSAAVASVLLLCFASLLESILSFPYLSTASRATAEPCTPLPAQSMGSPAHKWLQQWFLLLLAVYTALSLSPVLSQGETFHSGVDVSWPVWVCRVLCRPSQCRGHLLPGDALASLEGMRQCLTPVLGATSREGLDLPKAFLPFSSCCCVLGWLCLSSSLL